MPTTSLRRCAPVPSSGDRRPALANRDLQRGCRLPAPVPPQRAPPQRASPPGLIHGRRPQGGHGKGAQGGHGKAQRAGKGPPSGSATRCRCRCCLRSTSTSDGGGDCTPGHTPSCTPPLAWVGQAMGRAMGRALPGAWRATRCEAGARCPSAPRIGRGSAWRGQATPRTPCEVARRAPCPPDRGEGAILSSTCGPPAPLVRPAAAPYGKARRRRGASMSSHRLRQRCRHAAHCSATRARRREHGRELARDQIAPGATTVPFI